MKTSTKIVLWVVASIIALALIVVALLPSWLSSQQGTRALLSLINGRIDGKVTLSKIELNWFGRQRIENLSWVDGKGNALLSLPFFETETSLLYLGFGGRSFGKTTFERPYINLSQEMLEKIQKSEEEEEKKLTKGHPEKRLPSFRDSLFVHDGTIVFSSPKISPITISHIEIAKKSGTDCFNVSAESSQGNQRGTVSIQATCGQKMVASMKIDHFPVASLDELQGTTLFTDALGPTFSSELHFEKEANASLMVHGMVKSANLTAYIEGVTTDHKFSLSPQTHLEFIVTPALFKGLINEKERENWELTNKTVIKVDLEKGIFPLTTSNPTFNDIVLRAKLTINHAELHHQNLGVYSLNGFQASLIAQQNLDFAYSGEIQGKEHTKLEGHISVNPEHEIIFHQTVQGFPVSLISLVSPNLEKQVRTFVGPQFDLVKEGTYREGALDSKLTITSPMTQLKGDFTGTLTQQDFIITGFSHFSHEKAEIFGKQVDFSLNGTIDLTDQHLYIPVMTGNLSNDHLNIDIRGKVGEKGKPFAPESLQVVGSGLLKKFPMENMTADLQVDGVKNLIHFKAEGAGLEAAIETHHFIQEGAFNFGAADTQFSLKLRDFPTQMVAPLISDSLDLAPFIGEYINLDAEGRYAPSQEPRLILNFDAQGEGFAAALAIALDGSLIVKEKQPSFIYWDISPERYQALMRQLRVDPTAEPTFALTRTTKLQIEITQLSCPTDLSENLGHFLCQSGFVGKITLGTTNFKSKWSQDAISFQGIEGKIQGENFAQGINLFLKGNILAENIPESEKSSFSFEGEMLNFWTPKGRLNREGMTLKGVLNLDLLPVRQVTGIFPLDPETRSIVQAVLGELMNAHISGEISQMSGPLTIDIKASNFKATLPLQLQKNVVTLRDQVNAEITLTEAVNETLLKDINPLFIAGAFSDHPLRLWIDPQGFLLPIRPYSLQGLQIGRAMLDIGRIRVRNGGQVQYLVNFLKAKEVSHDGLMQAWFTPIYFSLYNGVASYNRFDALLASNIHIAMWGSINLLTNQVSMILGIAPSTIAQRFKISGLGKQNMFQVKMRGTTDKLDLDWSAASTRIAILVAKNAAGGLGALIGGLLEPILTANLGEEPVPPPTSNPLPWENIYSSDPSQFTSKKRKK